MGAETIAECVARAQLVVGVSYEKARAGCAPIRKTTAASTGEVLAKYWPALVLALLVAVLVTVIASEWNAKPKGKYQR